MMILTMTQYLSYPTAIKMAEIPNGFTPPLISLCNHRHISSLVLQRLINIINYKDNVDDSGYPCRTDLNGTSTTPEVQYSYHVLEVLRAWRDYAERDAEKSDKEYYASIIKYVISRETIFTQLSQETLKQITTPMEEFIISCRNGDSDCNLSEYLTDFYHSFFYKCYTYDPLEGKSLKEPVLEGIDNGITFVFLSGTGMIQNSMEVPGFDNSLKHTGGTDGVRIVLHSNGIAPDPLNHGVDIPTGASVVLGIKSHEVQRLQKPYGNCTAENYEEAAFAGLIANKTVRKDNLKGNQIEFSKMNMMYNAGECKKFCHQKYNLMKCGCLEVSLPSPVSFGNEIPLCSSLKFEEDLKITDCCMDNIVNKRCLDTIEKIVSDIICLRKVTINDRQCQCPSSCDEIHYETSYSISTWPAKGPQLNFAYNALAGKTIVPYFK